MKNVPVNTWPVYTWPVNTWPLNTWPLNTWPLNTRPLNTRLVRDIRNKRTALSTHTSQQAAEADAGLPRRRYGARLLVEAVADRMGCPCR